MSLCHLTSFLTATDATNTDKKKKKKVKKSKAKAAASGLGTRVVDADHAWEQAAPSKEDIDHKWELDAAEDERPIVVAEGEDLVDAQDLPVYVNSEDYLGELRAKQQQQEDADGDLSPPRKRPGPERRDDDASPPRKPRDVDASPPRRRSNAGRDASRRRRGGESDGDDGDDASPPRRKQQNERRGRDEDDTPSRRRSTKASASPIVERKSTVPLSEEERDASPPRRLRRNTSPSKQEERKRRHPPSPNVADRKRRVDSLGRDVSLRSSRNERRSPPREKKDDVSVRHRGRTKPSEQSHPLDTNKAALTSKPDARVAQSGDLKEEAKESKAKKPEESQGKKAGLFTPAEFEQQRKLAAKSKDVLGGANAAEMGANAETVYRDKRGRKLDMLNEMVRQQEVLDGKREREAREEYEWGTGEVQKRELKSQQELLQQMKQMPFARHEDDEELERNRRERVRAFDPINSKVFQEDVLAGPDKLKKKSKKGRKKDTKVKPKYSGPPAPPNRFGIMPGYRWDGVVRGTGWEEKLLMRQNANAAFSEEAYKYAVADM
ncbi:hypothetical protein BBJ28_00000267 [Nothophytophthora sp. Chile5]|nr:hypothetical protein BBJ28_00000267 [Nothophytophthora sp. Chile5]